MASFNFSFMSDFIKSLVQPLGNSKASINSEVDKWLPEQRGIGAERGAVRSFLGTSWKRSASPAILAFPETEDVPKVILARDCLKRPLANARFVKGEAVSKDPAIRFAGATWP
jgi:hypothetical protein